MMGLGGGKRFGIGVPAPGQSGFSRSCHARRLEHDPEKWEPVFGKDHAQTKS
jgi:hypothetical protein